MSLRRRSRLHRVVREPEDPFREAVIVEVGGQQRLERRYDPPDVSVAPGEALMMDQDEARPWLPDRGILGRQPHEIGDVCRNDRAALRSRRGPQRVISRTNEVRALNHSDNVVPLEAQLDRDRRREMLVEQEPHAGRR